jgi:uncharacterized protein (TIGR02246 family)
MEQAVDGIVKTFTDGFNAGDAAAIAAMFAEDGDAGGWGGNLYKGRAALQEAFADSLTAYKGSTIQLVRTGLHVVAPDVVVVDTSWEVSGGTVEEGSPTKGFMTLVLAKQGDSWQVVSSRTKVPPSN